MRVARHGPLGGLRRLEDDFDEVWRNGWNVSPALSEPAPMDMYEEDGKLVVRAVLPSFKKDEVSVSAEDGRLVISAQHKEKVEEKQRRHYYFREMSNKYSRQIVLPAGVEADRAKAGFDSGVLTVTMPAPPHKKHRKVEVK